MFGIAEPWSWVALDYLRHTGETSVLSRSFTSHGVRAEPAAGALDASRRVANAFDSRPPRAAQWERHYLMIRIYGMYEKLEIHVYEFLTRWENVSRPSNNHSCSPYYNQVQVQYRVHRSTKKCAATGTLVLDLNPPSDYLLLPTHVTCISPFYYDIDSRTHEYHLECARAICCRILLA